MTWTQALMVGAFYVLIKTLLAKALSALTKGRISFDQAFNIFGRIFWWIGFSLWLIFVAVLAKLGIFSAFFDAFGVIFSTLGSLLIMVPKLLWALFTS